MNDLYKLQLGGISSATALVMVHPLDTAKVRMQIPVTSQTLKYKASMSRTLSLIFKEEGFGSRGLYKGFSASLLREMTYSSMRLGFYEPLKRIFGANNP